MRRVKDRMWSGGRRGAAEMSGAIRLAIMVLALFAGAGAVEAQGPGEAREAIAAAAAAFSRAYMEKDWEAIASSYTEDAVAIPAGSEPVRGRAAIRRLFELPPEITVVHHRIIPTELVVLGDHAYDWGIYEVRSARSGEEGPLRQGTYTVVWRRGADGVWRMKVDMWAAIRSSN